MHVPLSNTNLSEKESHGPWPFVAAKWHGFVLAAIYLIYGGIKIVLAVLDRNYADMVTPILFGGLGIVLLAAVYAYRDRKLFGWYGLVGINGLVIILSIFSMKQYGLILLILSAAALAALLAPITKAYFPARR
jgi:hypothetical protein